MKPGRDVRRRQARPADRLSTKQRSPRTQPSVGVQSEVSTGSTRALALVFLVALAIRLLHVWELRGAPVFVHLMGDSRAYDEWAQKIAAGDWLGTGVFYQAPLYPYVIGMLYALFGRDLLFVRLVQAVLGAGSCALVAAAGVKWFGRRAGILWGLLLAAYAPAVFFDALIQKSVLDGLLVAALLLALAVRGNSGIGIPVITGVLLGLLVLSRENAVALLPVVVMSVWGRSQRRLPAALTVVAATALVLAPVAIRNLIVGGELHMTTAQLGPNFYIGNNANATGKVIPKFADGGPRECPIRAARRDGPRGDFDGSPAWPIGGVQLLAETRARLDSQRSGRVGWPDRPKTSIARKRHRSGRHRGYCDPRGMVISASGECPGAAFWHRAPRSPFSACGSPGGDGASCGHCTRSLEYSRSVSSPFT